MKRILLISHWYYPRNNPRAFRARALADELINLGYEADVLSGETKSLIKCENLKNYYVNCKNICIETSDSRNRAKILIKPVIRFLIGEKFYLTHIRKMMQKADRHYDVLIAVCNPFYTAYLSVHLKKKYKNKPLVICDCGDPWYLGFPRHSFLVRQMQKYVFRNVSFITVPIKESLKYYARYADREKIRVIPQGFRTEGIVLKGVCKREGCIRFAYAGRFYMDIRSPEKLLEYLSSLKQDFVFTIYTDCKSEVYRSVLMPYKKVMGSKLRLKDFLPREECIYELSGYDFLINIENTSSIQSPSKLIDYAIAQRPVLSCSPIDIPKENINRFLKRDYTGQLKIDITPYKIENVAKQFVELIEAG